MGPDFGALLDDADGDLASGGSGQLLQPDRCGEPGWAAAGRYDIVFHGFALHRSRLPARDPSSHPADLTSFGAFKGSAKKLTEKACRSGVNTVLILSPWLRAPLAELLRWYVAMGADEAIGDDPIDRLRQADGSAPRRGRRRTAALPCRRRRGP